MTYWTGRDVKLYLSEAGRVALAHAFRDAEIEVSVEWSDELGLWIVCEPVVGRTRTVMLIRWTHFETAVLDVVMEEPQPPGVLGFRQR